MRYNFTMSEDYFDCNNKDGVIKQLGSACFNNYQLAVNLELDEDMGYKSELDTEVDTEGLMVVSLYKVTKDKIKQVAEFEYNVFVSIQLRLGKRYLHITLTDIEDASMYKPQANHYIQFRKFLHDLMGTTYDVYPEQLLSTTNFEDEAVGMLYFTRIMLQLNAFDYVAQTMVNFNPRVLKYYRFVGNPVAYNYQDAYTKLDLLTVTGHFTHPNFTKEQVIDFVKSKQQQGVSMNVLTPTNMAKDLTLSTYKQMLKTKL